MKGFVFIASLLFLFQCKKLVAQDYSSFEDLSKHFIELINQGNEFESFEHFLVHSEEALSAIEKNATNKEIVADVKKELKEDFDQEVVEENTSRWSNLKNSIGERELKFVEVVFEPNEKMTNLLGINVGEADIYVYDGEMDYKIHIDKVFELENSWRINEIGASIKPIEADWIDNEEVEVEGNIDSVAVTEEAAEAEAEVALPEKFKDLTGKWRFAQLVADGKDMTEAYVEGRLGGEKYTMTIDPNGNVLYNEKYKETNQIVDAQWDYLYEDERPEDESTIDFTLIHTNKQGNTGVEKFTLVEVTQEKLRYKNEALKMGFTFKRAD